MSKFKTKTKQFLHPDLHRVMVIYPLEGKILSISKNIFFTIFVNKTRKKEFHSLIMT